jgi:hypothetical protein
MPEIRLNKRAKTIKIVNRKESLRLQHTGKTGPQGEQGETGISTFVRVHHGINGTAPRPNAEFVEWVGSTEPLNGTVQDTWVDTA